MNQDGRRGARCGRRGSRRLCGGSGGGTYAAQLADRRGLDLVVAHAYDLTAVPPISASFINIMRDAAQRVLDRALAELDAPAGLRVAPLLMVNSPVLMLRGLAELAELIVVGHHHVGLEERLLLGKIAAPVAAKSPCPVVVVPAGWNREDSVGRPVVVALDGETPARGALDYAFGEAELTGARLLAVHATPLDELPTDSMEDEASITEILAGGKQDHPDTAVHTRLVSGDAVDALIGVSERAAVLVVGRPHSGSRFGSWTWSVANAVVDDVSCPLVIVPQQVTDDALGLRRRQRAVLTSEA